MVLRLGYDCAHGSITEKDLSLTEAISPARGRHVREHPDRSVKARPERTARDLPRLGGWGHDELDLALSNSKRDCWDFTLTHGRSGRLRRCG